MGAEVGPGLAGAAQEGVPILCAGCRLGVWLRFSREWEEKGGGTRSWLSGRGPSWPLAGRGSQAGRRRRPPGRERAARVPGPGAHSGPGGGRWAPAGPLGPVLVSEGNSGVRRQSHRRQHHHQDRRRQDGCGAVASSVTAARSLPDVPGVCLHSHLLPWHARPTCAASPGVPAGRPQQAGGGGGPFDLPAAFLLPTVGWL